MHYDDRHIPDIASAYSSYLCEPTSTFLQLAPIEYLLHEAFEVVALTNNGHAVSCFTLKPEGKGIIPEIIDHLIVFSVAGRLASKLRPVLAKWFERFDPEDFRETLEGFLRDKVEDPEQLGRQLDLQFRLLVVANTEFKLEVAINNAKQEAVAFMESVSSRDRLLAGIDSTLQESREHLPSLDVSTNYLFETSPSDAEHHDDWSQWDLCKNWATKFGKSTGWLKGRLKEWIPEVAEREGQRGRVRFRTSFLREQKIDPNAD